MARETDFLALYKQLGLNPGCELAELKQAYRRRVAALHPDRDSDHPTTPQAPEQLQRLTALYGAAMDFQRRHDRLPGALGVVANPRRPPAGWARPPAAGATRHGKLWLLIALLVIAAGWWLGDALPPESSATDHAGLPPLIDDAEGPSQLEPRALAIGMDARTVQLIQGAPVMISGDRWDYGPSWIRFEKDKVVDWYSSPLQQLRVGTARPDPNREAASHPTD